MAPTIGRIVLVKSDRTINGSNEFPAIVTAVHSESMINCRVFEDCLELPSWQTSIPREDTAGEGYMGATWRWPPRVDEP